MKRSLAIALFVFGAALAPVSSQAQDTAAKAKDNSQTAGAKVKEEAREAGAKVKAGASKVTKAVKSTASDSKITSKIKADYAGNPDVSALKIRVSTDHGVVRLRGKAKSQAEIDKAVEIAKNTEGVASVKNDIKLVAAKTASSKPMTK